MINIILFIGDPHFKVNNNDITDVFVEECLCKIDNLLTKYNSEELLCVLGGDILDTHERLHQTPYNKALKFINSIRKKIKCVILVGNHDFENNQQFLSDKHWMNPLKEWKNVYIVDNVLNLDNYVFVPYVPPGRFVEALNTLTNFDWRDAKCIFAHQEFKGCKLGNNTVSDSGDHWPLYFPMIVSGHIHKNHKPQKNIYYPGSVVQHNFGEQHNKNIILLIDFTNKENVIFQEIPINVPSMSTIEITCADFDKTIKNITLKPLQRIRLNCNGTEEQFKRIRKTTSYNNLPLGVYVSFKNINIADNKDNDEKPQLFLNFDSILNEKISNNYDLITIFDMMNNEKSFCEISQKLEIP